MSVVMVQEPAMTLVMGRVSGCFQVYPAVIAQCGRAHLSAAHLIDHVLSNWLICGLKSRCPWRTACARNGRLMPCIWVRSLDLVFLEICSSDLLWFSYSSCFTLNQGETSAPNCSTLEAAARPPQLRFPFFVLPVR